MFFDEKICIEGVRDGGRRIAAPGLSARVIDDGVPSDSIEGQLAALVDQYTFFVRAEDWPEVTPPHIGDTIIRDNDARFNVTRVARLADCFSLNARSR